jgi:hypothetical protein
MRNFICSTVNVNSFIDVSGAAFANSGTFTNTQMNTPFTFLLNGINLATEEANVAYPPPGGSIFATTGVAGGIAVPPTSTVTGAFGVAGYVNNSSTTTNAVGVYGQARALVPGTMTWGGNFLVSDGNNAGTEIGTEFDENTANSGTNAVDVLIGGINNTGSAHGAALVIDDPANNPWASAITTADGATQLGLTLGAAGTGANSNGQVITLVARDSSNTRQNCTESLLALTAGATMVVNCATGNIILGSGSALATTSTLNFPMIPTMPGLPTGSVGGSGQAPIVVDSTDNKLCWSSAGGGVWKCVAGS